MSTCCPPCGSTLPSLTGSSSVSCSSSSSLEQNNKPDHAEQQQQQQQQENSEVDNDDDMEDDEDLVTDEMVQKWLNGNQNERPVTRRRDDYLSWDDYFMATACLSAQRSKEPGDSGGGGCGCCLAHGATKRILAVGYTGFPRRVSDHVVPWHASPKNEWLWTRDPYAVHAPVNAVLNSSNRLTGAICYVTQFPCHDCTKVLIQAGISKIIYRRQTTTLRNKKILLCCGSSSNINDADHDDESQSQASITSSRIMLHLAKVTLQRYRPQQKHQRVIIDLGAAAAGTAAAGTAGQSTESPLPILPATTTQPTTTIAPNNNNDKITTESMDPRLKYRELMLTEARGYDPVIRSSGCRTDVLTWTDYFMALACLTAQRSKDPNTQVGACLVDSKTNCIVGLGYNGFPRNCSDDILPWTRAPPGQVGSKYMYVCHAEVNAILNRIIDNNGDNSSKRCDLYVALFPCHACAKVICQSNIVGKVVYQHDTYHDTDSCRASRILFHMAGIELEQYQPPAQSQQQRLTLILQD